ncbi:hypothetical protein RclHR1_06130005 [Rhizophagus clarus]|uniref:HMG box domain-containing protein n=1 Tax=Rhizophagus clarus TaxID=94130 RepID=A0A2Z6RRG8_9GLOM|nr:hypothetical protein RclHR1_06130005 [Rhizophagus clarus]GES73314.1 hypothetical protein GLOIN_2v1840627 [Rhizophagus clarus]
MPFPTLSVNNHGKIALTVARYCILNHELPHVDSFINAHHYNGFFVYRSILHKELRGINTEEISRIAGESWNLADKEFQSFFTNYANKINEVIKKNASPKFKQFEMKTKRKCANYSKKSKYFYIEQEELTRKIFAKEVEEFEFVSL